LVTQDSLQDWHIPVCVVRRYLLLCCVQEGSTPIASGRSARGSGGGAYLLIRGGCNWLIAIPLEYCDAVSHTEAFRGKKKML